MPPPNFRPLFLGLLLGLVFWIFPAAAGELGEAGRLLKAGEAGKALAQIDRFLAGRPKDAQGRFLRGLALTALNKPDDAIAVFRKLTEDYPELPEPYNNLAVIYAQKKQYDKARDALEKAIRTHPAYATAHENLGDLYSRLASQAYFKALQIDGSNTSAQTKLAMIGELVGGPAQDEDATAKTVPQPLTLAKVGAGTTAAAPAPTPTPAPPPPPQAAPPQAAPAQAVPAQAAPAKMPAVRPATPPPAAADASVQVAPDKPAHAVSDSASPEVAVTRMVDAWLAAWAKKEVGTYLSFYAANFRVPKGQSRPAWEAERTQRVGKPGKIVLERGDLKIGGERDGRVTVRFRQTYKSSGFKSSTDKVLQLVKHGERWLIEQEHAGG